MRQRRPTPRRREAPRWDAAEWMTATGFLLQRSKGRCECCGDPLYGQAERHHRKRRRDGGDRLSNLLLLLPDHHADVTGNPTWAVGRGLIVRVVDEPDQQPVLYMGRHWMRLDDAGLLTPAPDAGLTPIT